MPVLSHQQTAQRIGDGSEGVILLRSFGGARVVNVADDGEAEGSQGTWCVMGGA
jgi:hypothetical protein